MASSIISSASSKICGSPTVIRSSAIRLMLGNSSAGSCRYSIAQASSSVVRWLSGSARTAASSAEADRTKLPKTRERGRRRRVVEAGPAERVERELDVAELGGASRGPHRHLLGEGGVALVVGVDRLRGEAQVLAPVAGGGELLVVGLRPEHVDQLEDQLVLVAEVAVDRRGVRVELLAQGREGQPVDALTHGDRLGGLQDHLAAEAVARPARLARGRRRPGLGGTHGGDLATSGAMMDHQPTNQVNAVDYRRCSPLASNAIWR